MSGIEEDEPYERCAAHLSGGRYLPSGFWAAGAQVGAMRCPRIWMLEHLVSYCVKGEQQARLPDGRWVPARPLGFASLGHRIHAAKLVLTGRADAVLWEGQ